MIFENSKNPQKDFEELKELTRDHSRTVMQWNGNKFAGFSTKEPWSYVNKNYKTCNVENCLKDENSILNNYKKLIEVRNEYSSNLINSTYKFFNKIGLIGYKIIGKNCVLNVVANLSKKDKNININKEDILYSNFESCEKLKKYQIVIYKEN